MSRLPIRARLTLAFALAMVVVLVAVGAFVYFRLASSLDEAIDESLKARAADASAFAARGDPGFDVSSGTGLVESEESFGQVLDVQGRVVDATPQVGRTAVLTREELEPVLAGRVATLDRDHVRGIEARARLLATAVETARGRRVVVVGASLEDRDDALAGLVGQLLVVAPVALGLASLLGYGVATAALRPVESMRAEATAISAAAPGRRLPLPPAHDEIFRLGETLNEMLERLERAIERERSFVASASHELRTPLALLKAELDIALRRPRTAAELEEAVRSAAAETDRLVQLAEDLLILARSDRGRLPVRRTTVSARELLERVARRFASRSETTGRPIEVDAPSELRLEADEARLEQAVGNLVDNALRHGAGSVSLVATRENGAVELHVRDDGPGFPAEFLPRAFERFSRADEARSGPGTGLGLAIARLIAEAHEGSAHAVNRDGRGADVWLSLPA
jgi:heavy metal sensor kinase